MSKGRNCIRPHLHCWGRWEDVAIHEKPKVYPYTLVLVKIHTIKQQRRCSVCNLVQTRTS
jgi:hypothetical protein